MLTCQKDGTLHVDIWIRIYHFHGLIAYIYPQILDMSTITEEMTYRSLIYMRIIPEYATHDIHMTLESGLGLHFVYSPCKHCHTLAITCMRDNTS